MTGLATISESNRESAQIIAPAELRAALNYVRSQRQFLLGAGIDVSSDIDTLDVTNLKFQHITMDLGALAEKSFLESK
jgi:hypothetical protein